MSLLFLLGQFLLLGVLTFGGGLVAITLLFNAFVIPGWITETFFYQMVTIAESTPGPIAINLATYLGFTQFGMIGGVLATFGFVLPSTLAIWILDPLVKRFQKNLYVQDLLKGLRVMIFGLILITLVRMSLSVYQDIITLPVPSIVLLLITALVYPKLKNRPYLLIAFGAVFGVLFF
ncbi:MAG: chromate transporter [Bacilli bacterium]